MKLKYIILALLACLALPASADVRIGVINMERIMRESEPAKKAATKLEKEFKKRSGDLDKTRQEVQSMQDDMAKNGAAMSESARAAKSKELAEASRELQRKQREFNEDLNARRNEELQAFNERTNMVIRAMAEKENFDLIVVQEAVLYASPRVDVTERVIKALSEPAAGK